MSKDEKNKKSEEAVPANDAEPANIKEESVETKAKDAKDEKPSLSENEVKLQKQIDEQNDRYIRLYAEYDNFRKRSVKEKTDAYSDAYSNVVNSFLPLMDNLERALEYEKDNEGVNMIIKQMKDIFDKLGVKVIESDGAQFDPNFHNAIAHEDDPEKGESIITQTFQKGYTLNDKVIRHAMVKVAN